MFKKFSYKIIFEVEYGFFFLSLIFTALFWSNPNLLIFFLTIIAVLLLRKQSKKIVVSSLITGLLGGLSEIFAIHFGAWQYSRSQLFGIPLWLFPLWAIAFMFFRRIQIDLEKL